jgi:HlyD family secretion protein
VPGREGLPILIPLRLGITDGRMTEVLAGDLTEGQLIITGAAVGPEEGTDRASSLLKFRLR